MTFYPYPGRNQPEAFRLFLEAYDPDRRIDDRLWSICNPDGAVLIDIGSGNGHLALRYAARCRHVFALEPDPPMLRQIHECLAGREAPANVSVLAGSAEEIPLADESVDIVHARFAYFFGTPACLPGLQEARRVLKAGGSMFVIEGSTCGDFGAICRERFPAAFADQSPVLEFWKAQGFVHHHVETTWTAPDRETMQTALAMDLGTEGANDVLTRHHGCELTCGVHVFHSRR
jgi:ubiquinone/menaquinone biosynthesis C-methylase UbiE